MRMSVTKTTTIYVVRLRFSLDFIFRLKINMSKYSKKKNSQLKIHVHFRNEFISSIEIKIKSFNDVAICHADIAVFNQ